METYNKWRKMVFEVAKVGFEKIAERERHVKIGNDFIEIKGDFAEGYSIEALCSDNTSRFKEFSFSPIVGNGSDMISDTFITSNLTKSKETRDEILVACGETGITFQKFSHFFQITIEGIKICFSPEKTKFFMHDGFDFEKTEVGFATFKKLAEEGYDNSAASGYVKFKSYPKMDAFQVKDRITLRDPFRWYLEKTVPQLIELYKKIKSFIMMR